MQAAVASSTINTSAAGPVLFPKIGPQRFKTIVLASLADDILDATLLLVYEKRFRPEEMWHAPRSNASRPRPTVRSTR